MCGRMTFTIDLSELAGIFPWLIVPDVQVAPRYNVAPTQPVPVVANDGKQRLDFYIWGLIPSWAKDPRMGSRMINARAETIAEKPAYRAAFRRRRCLVLVDGFYEWRKEPGSSGKTPMYIRMKSKEPFALAGLWERWHSPHGDEILSCTIITTTPNSLLATIHDRMPVILPPETFDEWLDPGEKPPQALEPLLKPYPADGMEAYAVTPMVNSPINDSPECILPA
jgi:putative SOS response-associated peptidase YedK